MGDSAIKSVGVIIDDEFSLSLFAIKKEGQMERLNC